MKRLLILIPLFLVLSQGAHSERVMFDGSNAYIFRRQANGTSLKYRLCGDAFSHKAIAKHKTYDLGLTVTFTLDAAKYPEALSAKRSIALKAGAPSDDAALYLPLVHQKVKEGVFSVSFSLPKSYRKKDVYLRIEILTEHANENVCLTKSVSVADLYASIEKDRNLTKE